MITRRNTPRPPTDRSAAEVRSRKAVGREVRPTAETNSKVLTSDEARNLQRKKRPVLNGVPTRVDRM